MKCFVRPLSTAAGAAAAGLGQAQEVMADLSSGSSSSSSRSRCAVMCFFPMLDTANKWDHLHHVNAYEGGASAGSGVLSMHAEQATCWLGLANFLYMLQNYKPCVLLGACRPIRAQSLASCS